MKNIYLSLSLLFVLTSCDKQLDEELSPWNYEQPQSFDANAVLLLKMDQDIKNDKFGNINSLMIIKNDHVIFENYYKGYKRDDLHPLNRASQSVLALMMESALQETSLSGSEKVIDQFPEYEDIFFNIPQKDKIEINHLLKQTSGFNWNEWNFSNLSADNPAEKMKEADDWVRFVLSTNMIREPGMEFNYNSGHSILLSAILEKNLPGTLQEYLKENLFDPLNITNYQWKETPNQVLNTASGLHLKTIDMAKLGYMILKNGVWENQRIVSETWLSTLHKTVAYSDFYTIGINWFGFYAFHPVMQSVRVNDFMFTWGEGGQFIFVSPHLDMVAVITANNYNNGLEFSIFNILRDYILPSLDTTQSSPTNFFN